MNSKKKSSKKIVAVFAVGIVVAAVSSAIPAAEACTTTIVTKGASADGSAYVTHSNDSFSSDPSIVYVPAR